MFGNLLNLYNLCFHRNRPRQYASLIGPTTIAYMVKMLTWQLRVSSSRKHPLRQWHLQISSHSIICASARVISRYSSENYFWCVATVLKYLRPSLVRTIGPSSSKDLQEILFNSKACCSVAPKWKLVRPSSG